MICAHCQKEIPDGSVYCTYCGEKAEKEVLPVPEAEMKAPADITERLLIGSRTVLFSGILLSLFLSLLKFQEGTIAGICGGILIILAGSFLSWVLSLFLESRAELLRTSRRIEAMLAMQEDPKNEVFSDGKE